MAQQPLRKPAEMGKRDPRIAPDLPHAIQADPPAARAGSSHLIASYGNDSLSNEFTTVVCIIAQAIFFNSRSVY